MSREFKYYPEDFDKLKVKPIHMDLDFDVYSDYVIVDSKLKLKILDELQEISLDANNLQINLVKCESHDITHEYKKEDNKLIIKFLEPISKDKEITIHTNTKCTPTKNILEGIYFDETPKDAPPTMITQCQQWGFQRIVPSIDTMDAKCTYITKITADSKYTHLITNGDVKTPRKDENGRSTIIYDNTKTPMAPYLFFLGCGTYDEHKRIFEYPDGSTFEMVMLTFPKTDETAAKNALEVLHNAILWIHIFTGAESNKQLDLRQNLYDLVLTREKLKFQNKDIIQIKEQIASLASDLNLGYKYTGRVYREIAMQNSNFGGMENVGNTTITANRMLPFAKLPDGAFEYLIAVKAHEFYHNINGSEVTGKSPFELWLNEAVTCHVEHKYMEFVAGEQYARLEDVLHIISPDGGTLDYDTGSMTMSIIPDGFNYPDDLISDVTYSKGPEFVRMIETVMGKDIFAKALSKYYEKFKHSNATTGQWIDAMNEISGMDFKRMAKVWLKQSGYPILKVQKTYENNSLKLKLTQSGFKEGMHYEFPFSANLYDKDGKIYATKQIFIQKIEQEIIFNNIKEPHFISLCPGYMFYGKIEYQQDFDEIYEQLRLDQDSVNRYIALCKLADNQKKRILNRELDAYENKFIDTYFELLSNHKLIENLGTAPLAIPESVDDTYLKHRYHDLYKIRKDFKLKLAKKYKQELLKIYEQYNNKEINTSFTEKMLYEIKMREIKNTALSILSSLDSEDIHKIILNQFNNPKSATDKYVAFALLLNSQLPSLDSIINEYEKEAQKDLVEWEVFLARIGANDSADPIKLIKKVEKSESFRIEQSNDQRALFMRFAFNKRISLQTEQGREYLEYILKKLSKINEYNTVHILSVFSKINDFEEKYHEPLVKLLVSVASTLDEKNDATVFNTIKRLLKGASAAVVNYEIKNDKITFLK